jgi:hypothetical protein
METTLAGPWLRRFPGNSPNPALIMKAGSAQGTLSSAAIVSRRSASAVRVRGRQAIAVTAGSTSMTGMNRIPVRANASSTHAAASPTTCPAIASWMNLSIDLVVGPWVAEVALGEFQRCRRATLPERAEDAGGWFDLCPDDEADPQGSGLVVGGDAGGRDGGRFAGGRIARHRASWSSRRDPPPAAQPLTPSASLAFGIRCAIEERA